MGMIVFEIWKTNDHRLDNVKKDVQETQQLLDICRLAFDVVTLVYLHV